MRSLMDALRCKLLPLIATWIVIIHASGLTAEQIPVRHIEGVTLGFLVLRNTGWRSVGLRRLETSGEARWAGDGRLAISVQRRIALRGDHEVYATRQVSAGERSGEADRPVVQAAERELD